MVFANFGIIFVTFKKIKIDEKVILDRKFEDINYNKTNLMTRKLIKILGLTGLVM